MIYYLYETKNLINGKIYVGVHQTEDIDDGYMGSGKALTEAIEKHGSENFKKTILEFFEDRQSMFSKEKEIVNEEFLKREDVYNIIAGGHGGFHWINESGIKKFSGKHTEETKQKIREKMTGKKNPKISEIMLQRGPDFWKKVSEGVSKSLKGKKKSAEHKAKIAEAVRKKIADNPEIVQKQKDGLKLYHERKRRNEE